MLIGIITGCLVFVALLTVLIYYSHQIEASLVQTEWITVKSDKINKPVLIMQLSDFHLYKNMKPARLQSIKDSITNFLQKDIPDLVFLTGDYIDKDSGIDILNDILALLKAKSGIYAVLGNHDYNQYNLFHVFSPLFFLVEKEPTDLVKLKKVMSDNKVNLLSDEMTDIQVAGNKLEIIGIDAKDFKQKEYDRFKIDNDNKFRIVLSHYPDAIRYLKGSVDILFAGHTHGGQVTIFGLPIMAKSKIKKSQAKGASVHGDTILFISKGVGVSHYFPFRFFANPDISIIDLESAK